MNENQFDEFFRDKLLKYSSPIPEGMWQRIQQKKDKDRRVLFFKSGLAILLFAFLTLGYFIWHSNKNMDSGKDISAVKKLNIDKQSNSKLSTKTTNNGTIKAIPDSSHLNQKNKRITPAKQFNSNQTNIYSTRYPNKKFKTDQYFGTKKTSSGKYISKQNARLTRQIIISRSFKDSTNITIKNASDSSINNYETNNDIVKKYPDSINERRAITTIALPKDSSVKKDKTSSDKPSKRKSELLHQQEKWFLDVYASPDIPLNKITSVDANLADYIKRSYKMQVSYTAGVRVGKCFDKYFSIKTGFQYSQINTQFDNGNSNNMKALNKFESIDIPFFIGYNMGHGDYTNTINAGIIFNMYTWYKGISLDSSANVANIYKQNTGISLYVGWSFVKQLNNKMQIFAEPYFRYHLSYMTRPQSTFNQKINIAGILFGLKYNFQMNRQQK